MDFLKDRRAILIGGAGLALAAGLAVAVVIAMHQDDSDAAPPASVGGLVVQTGRDDGQKLEPQRPLRCFVSGRLVGEMPVADCAKKNGVATGALDVGVDSTGGLAAATAPTTDVIPPPPDLPATDQAPSGVDRPVPDTSEEAHSPSGAVQSCWSYSTGNWSRTAADLSLDACVQSLFAGQCVRPGAAAYGRWGGRTLRLVLGKVEISSDNRSFRTLTQQQGGCTIPSTE